MAWPGSALPDTKPLLNDSQYSQLQCQSVS